jgi:hypothetical protein
MTEKRVALIIASYQYEDEGLRQLVAPAQDAEALARVLAEPTIGGFEVRTCLNESSHKVRQEIEAFLVDRKRGDLLLLYFSGHGIKDRAGQLYFATIDTQRNLLRSSTVAASFVNEVMRDSRSRRQVLLLDCCYSGAFARGMVAKAGDEIGTREYFKEGRGRVVLTASDAMQYAFEGDEVKGKGVQSVFTHALVRGLQTGEADLDMNGEVSFEELYEYAYDQVTGKVPQQRPRKWAFDVEGEIIIAQNPKPIVTPIESPKLTQPIELPIVPPPTPDFMDKHYKTVVKALARGRVIPFSGDGANLCGRPRGMEWQPGQFDCLPTSSELAAYLAKKFDYPYPSRDQTQDLVKVSQYVTDMYGIAPVHEELHYLLDGDYPPTPLHHFFASLPAVLREKAYQADPLLVVTTNYDDALECAFQAAGEAFDMVTYVGAGEHRGRFLHRTSEGETYLIEKPNEYRGLFGGHRPVILKIKGGVDRTAARWESFVIGEDRYAAHYRDREFYSLLPIALAARLRRSHFLFLGSLRDQDVRYIVRSIMGGTHGLSWRSWLIDLNPLEHEQRFWIDRGVDVLNMRLDDYVAGLSAQMQALPAAGGAS